MQPEERDPQQTFEQKLSVWILALVQDFIRAEKSGQKRRVVVDRFLHVAASCLGLAKLRAKILAELRVKFLFGCA